ncbi:MAG: glycosyl hydrolase family 28-related protein [Planctomycetota bacterium]
MKSQSRSARRRKWLRRRHASLQRLEERRMTAASDTTPDFVVPTSDAGFEDAAIVDVTRWSDDATLNANPAAGNNDHAALQAAVDTFAGTGKILYLPEGVYEIDRPLVMPILQSNRATAQTILQGQNRDRVILKVTDNIALDGAAVVFQVTTADAFCNAVRDLTIDVGAGNPDATGLRFTGNNQATVRNVHIRSSDPERAGDIGLELGTGENGPLLIENVSVDGFDVGIRTAVQTASQTFEDITLTGQNVYGWVNEADQNVFVRNLTSVNEVRAIHNFPFRFGENSVFTLIDSRLQGIGKANDVEAILTEERFYARNVATPGYQRPIRYRQANGFIAGNRSLDGDLIQEYWSEGIGNRRTGGTFEVFAGSPDTSLGLPIRDAPEMDPDSDLSRWASPTAFITANADGSPSGIAGDAHDDSLAIQAAIDSGATTIYFPNQGRYVVDSTVSVRGNVQRLIGLESTLFSRTGDGVMRLENTAADATVIERFRGGADHKAVHWHHVSDQTIVARNLRGFHFDPVADEPGDLFLYDVVQSHFEFRNQNVWARQLNTEGRADVGDDSLPDQKILNDHANVWILGLKIENRGTITRTINGGRTEVLGVYRNNSNFSDADNPAFVTDDAATSIVNFDAATAASGAYALWAAETRDGQTQTSERFGTGHVYTAFGDATLWDVQSSVIIDNADAEVAYRGTWETAAGLPGGYIGADFRYSSDPDATATASTTLPVDGQYEVFVRWVNPAGGQAHAGHGDAVPIEIAHAGGSDAQNGETDLQTVDQRGGGGQWVSLGQFDFVSGQPAQVTVGTQSGNVVSIVDGFRFDLVSSDQAIPRQTRQFPIQTGENTFSGEIYSGVTTRFDAANGLLAGDRHLDDAPLRVTDVRQGIGGMVTFKADGSFEYDAHDGFVGWDVFQYTVTDGVRQTRARVSIRVDSPIAANTGEFLRERTPAEMDAD